MYNKLPKAANTAGPRTHFENHFYNPEENIWPLFSVEIIKRKWMINFIRGLGGNFLYETCYELDCVPPKDMLKY